jgi:hypothetical protein
VLLWPHALQHVGMFEVPGVAVNKVMQLRGAELQHEGAGRAMGRADLRRVHLAVRLLLFDCAKRGRY